MTGGVIVGIGVASMHYMGMAAMIMPDSVHYNMPLFVLSVVIAIVAGTAALWAGTRVRSTRATIGASLIMGVAVSGMHYTGMAAMRVSMGSMAAMSGSTAVSFLVPLLVGITIVTFAVTLVISLSPTEDEIHEDARLRDRIATEFSADSPPSRSSPSRVAASRPPPPCRRRARRSRRRRAPSQPAAPPLPTRRPSADAFTGRARIPRGPGRWGQPD